MSKDIQMFLLISDGQFIISNPEGDVQRGTYALHKITQPNHDSYRQKYQYEAKL